MKIIYIHQPNVIFMCFSPDLFTGYISLYVASCKLTEDLGVARVDERVVDVVTRSHRRFAPATRHSIMLRGQSAIVFLGRSDKRVNYRAPSRETRVKRTPAREQARCIFMGYVPRCHKQQLRRTTEIYYTL